MAHYDIFRHHLAIKFPAYGHALWDPDPGNLSPAVEVGDVGYIYEGKFQRLFNALLPAGHASHRNIGVPDHHEQLTPDIENHINSCNLSPNNFCSTKVTSMPVSERLAQGPDEIPKVAYSCPMEEGAVLCLPIQAKGENTVARTKFGKWIISHIDRWFAWARQLELGVERMEDIILVTGTHRTRSWTNVAFPGGQGGAQALFGSKADHRGDVVSIHWQFSHEHNRGVVLNCGPNGEDLPEDQCIFIRGFRAARRFKILPPRLKGAAGPNPDPEGYDGPDAELIPVPAVPEYRDPLRILLECIAEAADGDCDMVLVHDDDLEWYHSGICGSIPLDTLQPNLMLSRMRTFQLYLDHTTHAWTEPLKARGNASTHYSTLYTALVATLRNDFKEQSSSSTPSASQSLHGKSTFLQRHTGKGKSLPVDPVHDLNDYCLTDNWESQHSWELRRTGPQHQVTQYPTANERSFDFVSRSLQPRVCDTCGSVEQHTVKPFRMCGGCTTAIYCSPECQKKHWPLHKAICQQTQPIKSSSGKLQAGGSEQNRLESAISVSSTTKGDE